MGARCWLDEDRDRGTRVGPDPRKGNSKAGSRGTWERMELAKSIWFRGARRQRGPSRYPARRFRANALVPGFLGGLVPVFVMAALMGGAPFSVHAQTPQPASPATDDAAKNA